MKSHYLFPRNRRSHAASARGFSLMELLVVLAVIGVIAGFAVPAFTEVMKGNQLKQTAELIRNTLRSAQQSAVKLSKPVVVQFYEFNDTETPGSGKEFRAMEVFQRETGLPPIPSGASANASNLNLQAITEIIRIPITIKVLGNSEYSTLLRSADNPYTRDSWTDLPQAMSRGTASAFYLEFRPDGSTNLADVPNVSSWHLTIVENLPGVNESELPPNYVTIQLDPYNGNTRTYQPGF